MRVRLDREKGAPLAESGWSRIGLAALVIFLAVLSADAEPGGAVKGLHVLEDAGNIASYRLHGRWRLDGVATGRIAGAGGGLPELALSADPEALEALSEVASDLFPAERVYDVGALLFGGREFAYGVGSEHGVPVLVVVPLPSGKSGKPFRLYFALVPARDYREDLLFLGGSTPTEPYAVYRRQPEAKPGGLRPETEGLLRTVLDGHLSPEMTAALEALPESEDWRPAAEFLLREIRFRLPADQNNLCLALWGIYERHPHEASALDTEPLRKALSIRSWTTQQKCSEALAAVAAELPVEGVAKERLIEVLIPLTASPRGRVVEPALRALYALTGAAIGRDAEGWSGWFGKTYGREVDLAPGKYEAIVVVRPEAVPGGGVHYSVAGGEPANAEAAMTELEARKDTARATGRSFAVVIQVPDETFARPDQDQIFETAGPLMSELQRRRFAVTVSPASDRFYPNP